MKKYVHIFEGQIVHRYQEAEAIVYGGPWAQGLAVQVPDETDLETVEIEDLNLEVENG